MLTTPFSRVARDARGANNGGRSPNVVELITLSNRRKPSVPRVTAVPKLDRNVEKDPSRCGGQPVVVGTRIRVATVLGCYRQGMSVEEIVQQYANLKPADVHDALAYAYDHLEEIEADLAADDEQTVKAQQGSSPPP
jgi:uncharacterized protein (DUF433 family)